MIDDIMKGTKGAIIKAAVFLLIIVIAYFFGRDSVTVEEAKNHLAQRENANLTKWKRMYGVDDFWDPKYYDLVINTYSHGPAETLDIVLQSLGYYANGT